TPRLRDHDRNGARGLGTAKYGPRRAESLVVAFAHDVWPARLPIAAHRRVGPLENQIADQRSNPAKIHRPNRTPGRLPWAHDSRFRFEMERGNRALRLWRNRLDGIL